MSYFIVLHGTLGSGKTTIANKLALVLKAKHIALDVVLKENNLDKHKPNSASISATNFIKGLDLVLPLAKQLLQNGQIVIFDGCFYHRKVLGYLISNLPFANYIFTLKAPLDVCIQRDKLRKKTLGENAAKAVYKLVHRNDYGITIETGSKSVQETITEILSYLPKPQ